MDTEQLEQPTLTLAPCRRCGTDTPQYAPALTKIGTYKNAIGACVCPKCWHAYACYLFMHELRKSQYQKREDKIKIAEYNGQKCSTNFRQKYGEDWRKHLASVFPDFEISLASGLSEPIVVESLCRDAMSRSVI